MRFPMLSSTAAAAVAAATPRIFSDVPLLNARSHELQITDDVDLRSRRGYSIYVYTETHTGCDEFLDPALVGIWMDIPKIRYTIELP